MMGICKYVCKYLRMCVHVYVRVYEIICAWTNLWKKYDKNKNTYDSKSESII